MSCGIYKIENLINHKCYIGQSIHIETRWKRHLDCINNYPLYKAIRKYGLENFSFVILEECNKNDLDSKEEYYMKKYNSLIRGYNQVKAGQGGVKLPYSRVLEIIKELKNNKTDSTDTIGKKFGVTGRTVRAINTGESWFDESLSYPIRTQYISEKTNNKGTYQKEHTCIKCGAKIYKGSKYCVKCSHELQYVCEHPSREELKQMIRTVPFVQIAKKYGVSDNAIKKWCISYNLPSKKKDIKAISDEDWLNI